MNHTIFAAATWQSPENLSDDKVDMFLEAGRTASDDASRQEAYASLNARLMEIAPKIYDFNRQSV